MPRNLLLLSPASVLRLLLSNRLDLSLLFHNNIFSDIQGGLRKHVISDIPLPILFFGTNKNVNISENS